MAEPVRARRLTEQEGQRLTALVRRGRGNPIRVRRAMIILASSSGAPVAAIARLVAADVDTVCDVIHAFDERGLAALDPQWAGGRPRLINDDDIAFVVTTATTRPTKPGCPFTRWSLPTRRLPRPLPRAPRCDQSRTITPDPARGRCVSLQRTRTWKELTDPDKDAKLDHIEHVTGPVLRLRPVRPSVDPALPRRHLVA